MKAYGVDRGDTGCCPGHDKWDGRYGTPRSHRNHARLKQLSHGRARALAVNDLNRTDLDADTMADIAAEVDAMPNPDCPCPECRGDYHRGDYLSAMGAPCDMCGCRVIGSHLEHARSCGGLFTIGARLTS